MYSDGSKQADGSAGAGAYITQLGQILVKESIPLGKYYEVYNIKIIGALTGLKAALISPYTRLAINIHIILDN